MEQIIKSLDEINTQYSIFEKDQVLTASQLNSISSYFEDQSRLTRTQLLGVGVVCGLRLSVQGRALVLGKGMGVTTDGDLIAFLSEQVYDRFKLYDGKNPYYAPFYNEETMIPLFELVPKGVQDKRAQPLSQFSEASGLKLASAMVLAYMENYVFDPNQCAGADCDNSGRENRNNQKILLFDRQYLGMLKTELPSPRQAFSSFQEIVVDRPVLSSGVTTTQLFVQSYRTACESLHVKLSAQLQNLYPACSSFLQGVFTTDPWQEWSSILNDKLAFYRQNATGIQYYFDFLKDLAVTFNQYMDLLYEDTGYCSPDPNAFPKHLILGRVASNAETDPDRTELYCSPLTSHTTEIRGHIQFLAGKMDVMIRSFQSPAAGNLPIRITPGMSESYPLEERAIPYYYAIDRTLRVPRTWNYDLSRRGKSSWNYSYNAPSYNAQGGAANPSASQLGRFDFFRIEGHIGQGIQQVHSFLELEIKRENLPVNLRSVMLSTDHTRLVIKPGFVFSDLYKFHNLLRHDLVNQLDEVQRYSGGLKTQVLSNLSVLDPADQGTFSQIAEGRHNDVLNAVSLASAKLSGSYLEYSEANTENDSWKNHVSNAMQVSGTFKGQLSIAAKTEFNTPFDTLISNRHIDLLDHLDELIKVDTQQKREKLLFGNYINAHPGLEHCAGVSKGGTFVVLYGEDGLVIGDFMLPYMEVDAEKLDLNEPPILIRPIRPGYVIDSGINLISPIDRKIRGSLDIFKANDLDVLLNQKTEGIRATLDNSWNAKFSDQQRDYFSSIKESFGTMSNALIKRIGTDSLLTNAAGFQDQTLQKAVNDMKSRKDVLASFKAKAEQAVDPAEKQKFNELASAVEEDLSNTITDATQHIANNALDLSVGSEGFNAMMEVHNAISSLNTASVVEQANLNLTRLAGTATNASFGLLVNNILRR
ncbi:MAG: hypothetical protein HXX13_17480 [Bacteroidetes bacterium]|nr:hypothetical protein [Bacteroidota bacterium]